MQTLGVPGGVKAGEHLGREKRKEVGSKEKKNVEEEKRGDAWADAQEWLEWQEVPGNQRTFPAMDTLD